MLSPCHCRYRCRSRLTVVSALSKRGRHAAVTAMPTLSPSPRAHHLAAPRGCRCSLTRTSRGRRRRQPHSPHLSCTSSLVSFSSIHRAACAHFLELSSLYASSEPARRTDVRLHDGVDQRHRGRGSGAGGRSAAACAGCCGDGTPELERAYRRSGAPVGSVG